jgi:hypothetical protein
VGRIDKVQQFPKCNENQLPEMQSEEFITAENLS